MTKSDPTNRSLFQLSYPLFLQSLVMFTVMAAEMMIWSAHAPQTAASLSIAGLVFRVAMELSAVMGIGAVILITQHLGRGDGAAARLTAEVACMANLVLGAVLSVAMVLVGPVLLRAMPLDPGLEAGALDYLMISAGGLLFLCFGNTAVACLRGYGRSEIVMVLGAFGAVLYLALGYMFVIGPGRLPALGAQGAGVANLSTRVLFAVVLACVVTSVLGLKLVASRVMEHGAMIRQMTRLALPSVSDFIAYSFYQIVLVSVIATQGELPVLARAYVMIAMSFLTLVIMAVTQGTEVLIGYRLGAKRFGDVFDIGVQSAWVTAGLAMGCAGLIYLGSDLFIGLFTDDPKVVALCKQLLWLTIFLQPCFAVNMVLFHALRAIEDVRWPVLVSQTLSWGVGLPLAWWLCAPLGFGVVGVWWAFLAEEFIKAVAMGWRWSHQRAAIAQRTR
ncbi:MATE family efflux transporter [Roseobacter sp.]|uniref:MATE family efflux transporter n=1 Tax=Roseobacter sp. TaxID=1907202 RepID=UPI003296FFDF